MIPQFPEFKIVEVGDRELVESHTHRYPPYSDFNFTSLWAWDTSNERMISELNGNLVVRFTDYKTNEPFLSFLGSNETEHTARTLLNYCKENGLPETLKLMPEVSIQGIRSTVLHVEEDRDNFDYMYSISELATLRGRKFKEKRQIAERFLRTHQEEHVEIGDLGDSKVQEQIMSVLRSWEDKKKSEDKEYELQHEEASINRLFQTAHAHKLIVTGVFFGDTMIGFSIDEILPNQYGIEHFSKADSTHRGVYDFLNEKVAQHLEENNIALWNWEQDLGVEGMRRSKMSYRPQSFLKKFTISKKDHISMP